MVVAAGADTGDAVLDRIPRGHEEHADVSVDPISSSTTRARGGTAIRADPGEVGFGRGFLHVPSMRSAWGGYFCRHNVSMTRATALADLVGRVHRIADSRPGQRVLIGIAGAPGSGKSTLAEALVTALVADPPGGGGPAAGTPGRAATDEWHPDATRAWIGSAVAHVPMDGFHLADVELARLGRAGRKGAPDTFDAGGYLALLRRLRTATATVWAPAFDRDIEQPVAGSIPIGPAVRVIITEGNYLLLDQPEWAEVATLLDEVWFCDPDPRLRISRLVARHERFGKAAEQAVAWATGPDESNALLVAATRARADLVITDDVVRPRSSRRR